MLNMQKNLIEQLKNIAAVKNDELIKAFVEKEFSKLPDTETWYFLDTFKTSGYGWNGRR